MLIVTTPALAAQKVAVRAADMARKGYLRVAGVIENMSGFTCDHGEHYDLFGSGGGERLAARDRCAPPGPIPLQPAVSAGGDRGEPAASSTAARRAGRSTSSSTPCSRSPRWSRWPAAPLASSMPCPPQPIGSAPPSPGERLLRALHLPGMARKYRGGMSSDADPGDHPTQPVRSLDLGDLSDLGPIQGLDPDENGFSRAGGTTGRRAPGGNPGSAPPTKGDPETGKRKGTFRYRILPRSVLGVSALILSFAIGAGFSGVVLFSYYQYKANQTDVWVNALVSGYKKQFANAQGQLAAEVAAAQSTIQQELKTVQQQQAGPQQLANLTKQVAPSVFFVHTLDASGQASVGTVFVISSNATESLLITSYTTVEAATRAPGPSVYVRQNGTDTQVTVRSWDPQYDLAAR